MLDTLATLPEFIDLAIIGAGPHALTLATHLLQKKKSMRGRFLVFDPSGTWMSRWHHQFAALEIPHLRSPAVHQPDPDPHALRTFADIWLWAQSNAAHRCYECLAAMCMANYSMPILVGSASNLVCHW